MNVSLVILAALVGTAMAGSLRQNLGGHGESYGHNGPLVLVGETQGPEYLIASSNSGYSHSRGGDDGGEKGYGGEVHHRSNGVVLVDEDYGHGHGGSNRNIRHRGDDDIVVLGGSRGEHHHNNNNNNNNNGYHNNVVEEIEIVGNRHHGGGGIHGERKSRL